MRASHRSLSLPILTAPLEAICSRSAPIDVNKRLKKANVRSKSFQGVADNSYSTTAIQNKKTSHHSDTHNNYTSLKSRIIQFFKDLFSILFGKPKDVDAEIDKIQVDAKFKTCWKAFVNKLNKQKKLSAKEKRCIQAVSLMIWPHLAALKAKSEKHGVKNVKKVIFMELNCKLLSYASMKMKEAIKDDQKTSIVKWCFPCFYAQPSSQVKDFINKKVVEQLVETIKNGIEKSGTRGRIPWETFFPDESKDALEAYPRINQAIYASLSKSTHLTGAKNFFSKETVIHFGKINRDKINTLVPPVKTLLEDFSNELDHEKIDYIDRLYIKAVALEVLLRLDDFRWKFLNDNFANQRVLEDRRDILEYETRLFDKLRTLEDRRRILEDKQRAPEDKQCAFKDDQHVLEDEQRAFKDDQHVLEDEQRTLNRQWCILEVKKCVLELKKCDLEDQQCFTEDQLRALEDRRRALEDRRRILEDKQRAPEDKQRAFKDDQHVLEDEKRAFEASASVEAHNISTESAKLRRDSARFNDPNSFTDIYGKLLGDVVCQILDRAILTEDDIQKRRKKEGVNHFSDSLYPYEFLRVQEVVTDYTGIEKVVTRKMPKIAAAIQKKGKWKTAAQLPEILREHAYKKERMQQALARAVATGQKRMSPQPFSLQGLWSRLISRFF